MTEIASDKRHESNRDPAPADSVPRQSCCESKQSSAGRSGSLRSPSTGAGDAPSASGKSIDRLTLPAQSGSVQLAGDEFWRDTHDIADLRADLVQVRTHHHRRSEECLMKP